jgi:hypothetical protein
MSREGSARLEVAKKFGGSDKLTETSERAAGAALWGLRK